MMKDFYLVILFLSILVACTNSASDEKNIKEDTAKNVGPGDNASIEQTDQKVQNNSFDIDLEEPTLEQKFVYNDFDKFINWYIRNRDSLFTMRERIVETDAKNIASINIQILNNYLHFLEIDGKEVFSSHFTKSEKNFWHEAHNEATEKEIVLEDIWNPWCFEADPIFNGHEWPKTYKEWHEDWSQELNPLEIELKGNIATFNFYQKREMVKENGSWKLKNWFANKN